MIVIIYKDEILICKLNNLNVKLEKLLVNYENLYVNKNKHFGCVKYLNNCYIITKRKRQFIKFEFQ